MLSNWKNWCRLCGNKNAVIDVFIKSENLSRTSDVIEKFLQIEIKPNDEISTKICEKCSIFLQDLWQFSVQTSKIQELFSELKFNDDFDTIFELDFLRSKYGLGVGLENCENEKETNQKTDGNCKRKITKIQEETNSKNENNDFSNDELSHKDNSTETDSENEIIQSIKNKKQKRSKASAACKQNVVKLSKKTKTTRIVTECELNLISCKICNKTFKLKSQLTYHQRRCHRFVREPVPCKFCGKLCKTEAICKVHENSHLPKDQREQFSCKDCDKKFNSQSGLWSHIHTVHDEEKSCICDQCGKKFSTIQHLTSHKFTHSNTRPHQCPHCPANFKRKDGLWAHIHIHGESHQCPVCKIKLSTKLNLRRHMICHDDKKNFKCNFCQKTFKRLKSLNSHLIIHIGVKPYECKFCNDKFVHDMILRRHLKKNHSIEYQNMEAAGEKITCRKFPKLEQLKAANEAAAKMSKNFSDFENKLDCS